MLWYSLDPIKVLEILDSDREKGLDDQKIIDRLKLYGPNQLKFAPPRSIFFRFLEQLNQPLLYIMNISGVISLWLHQYTDASVIFGVVLMAAIGGYIQETKSENALLELQKKIETFASVVRSNLTKLIPAGDLVIGDIVLLYTGDKVPADIRLLETNELNLDESILTGESLPVSKNTDVLNKKMPLSAQNNMVFSSTLITSGSGKGVVVATAGNTEIGKISRLLSVTETTETPLTKKLAKFSGVLLYVIMGISILNCVVGLLRGFKFEEVMMSSVALAVGAIPEGLPAAMTIILAISVTRMAHKKAIIRRLQAAETLGSTTVICADKTGTLTKNEMIVQQIILDDLCYQVTDEAILLRNNDFHGPNTTITDQPLEKGRLAGQGGQALARDPQASNSHSEFVLAQSHGQKFWPYDPGISLNLMAVPRVPTLLLLECLLASVLCNDAVLLQDGAFMGDPTEGALLIMGTKATFQKDYKRLDAIPFEEKYKYMATLHRIESNNIVFVKGAPEVILQKCTKSLDKDGRPTTLDRDKIIKQIQNLAVQGQRVLALAKTQTLNNQITHDDINELQFIGLVGMMDPPRPSAIKAIATCHKAGIEVKMITGDNKDTAIAIAEMMQIDHKKQALTGIELEEMDDATLIQRIQEISVFARIEPAQKLRIVTALQKSGHVVAMTGDGVNDAPALRKADIGIAMGKGGTEVAKEASDMVLLNDDFASIEQAIEEGRTLFDNLIKFIIWTLPTNLSEGLIILVAMIFGMTFPILPVQILWINMTTAVFLGLTLVFEPKEKDIMDRPPRSPKAPIFTKSLSQRIILVGLLTLCASFLVFWNALNTEGVNKARTLAVNSVVIMQLFYLLNCRSLKHSLFDVGFLSNQWLIGGIVLTIGLQCLYTYHPWMHYLFESASIGWKDWGFIVLQGIVAFVIVEIMKAVNLHRGIQ